MYIGRITAYSTLVTLIECWLLELLTPRLSQTIGASTRITVPVLLIVLLLLIVLPYSSSTGLLQAHTDGDSSAGGSGQAAHFGHGFAPTGRGMMAVGSSSRGMIAVGSSIQE